MEYSQLTKDQQRQIVEGRIAGLEADHFGHSLNLKMIEAQTEVNTNDVSTTTKNLEILEASILAARQELADLGE